MVQTSILIPTKDGQSEIEECLQQIYSQKGVEPFEVILVDSGSTDATLAVAGRYPVRIERIPPNEFHHARTRNFLAGLATGEFLVFLSQDAFPANDSWLHFLLENFKDPTIGAAYGRQLPKPEATSERHQVFSTLYGESRIVKRPGDAAAMGYKYYHFSSVSAAIRSKVWQITRFPEDLKVFEDVGIAKRILESGWSIAYEPRSAVYHSHNLKFSHMVRRYFDIGVVYKRLGIWNSNSRQSVRRDGWNVFRNAMLRKFKPGERQEKGASMLTNVSKFVAVELGRHEQYLPLLLKKKLSLYGLFD